MYKSHFNIIEPYPGWLDELVTTSEAAKITGVPKTTLVTMRSRGGNGPIFVRPENTRLVRYQRRKLYDWLFSGGIKKFTEDTNTLIEHPDVTNDNTEMGDE